MQAIISDQTKKTVGLEDSYKVEIYSRATKLRLEFDTEMLDGLKNLLSVATENGCKWKKLVKDETTGKWSKVPVETQPLQ